MISLSFCLLDLCAMLLLCIRHSPTEGWYQNLCYCSVYTCICVHIGSYDGLRYGPAAAGSVWQHWRRLCTTTATTAAAAIHGDAAIRRVPTAGRHCTAATAAVWGNGTAGYWIRYGPWHVLYGLCMLSVQAANMRLYWSFTRQFLLSAVLSTTCILRPLFVPDEGCKISVETSHSCYLILRQHQSVLVYS